MSKALSFTLANAPTQPNYTGTPILQTPGGAQKTGSGTAGVYNLYGILAGLYSTGVVYTISGGVNPYNVTAGQGSNLSLNTVWLRIQSDTGNVGKIRIGDANVSATNGYPLSPGGERLFEGEGYIRHQSLMDVWFYVPDATDLIEVEWM
jgi:hypothetical protein